jgi:hypothetical protein
VVSGGPASQADDGFGGVFGGVVGEFERWRGSGCLRAWISFGLGRGNEWAKKSTLDGEVEGAEVVVDFLFLMTKRNCTGVALTTRFAKTLFDLKVGVGVVVAFDVQFFWNPI